MFLYNYNQLEKCLESFEEAKSIFWAIFALKNRVQKL